MKNRHSAPGCLVLGLLALAAPLPAFAQTAPTPPPPPPAATSTGAAADTGASADNVVKLSEFVVTGQQASLASAEDIKMNTDEMVDSIVADDIDKLPDVNVSYALERITGVQVAHEFAGIGGNGAVTIDGLTEIESTIDGRDVFTAGGTSGGGVGAGERTFDYSDIPSALVAGIDVYKTAAANQLDGGLGGLIDVRLHKPFDYNGPEVAVTVGTTYSGLDNEDKPNYNVLVSDTTKTDVGKIGVLVDFSYQAQPWREDNIGIGNPTPDATAAAGAPGALIASGYTIDTSQGVFQTTGLNAVLQWQVGPSLNLYAGYNYEQWWNVENQTEWAASLPAAAAVPGGAQMFAGSSTAVESESFNNVTASVFGIVRDLTDRSRQYYAGGSWTDEALTLKLDVSRFDSDYGFYNNGLYVPEGVPHFSYTLGGTVPSGVVGGASTMDPSTYKVTGGQVYNRLDPATGFENAVKVDGQYDFSNSFLSSILGGIRYASTEEDNGTTGLFLGSYTLPAADNNLAQFPGGWAANPFQNFFSGYHEANVFQYLVPTSNLRDPQAVLTQYGDTATTVTTDASVNPLSLFHITEATTAFYLEPKFTGNIGGLPFDGNLGVRVVETNDQLDGFQTVTPASVSSTGKAILGPLAVTHTYWDYLPSINARLKLTDKLYLRAAASKTITRPNFSQMSPSLTLNENPITPSLNTGSQGNTALQPMRSTNLDVSLEYYLNKSAMIYVAGLYKDVTGFPASISTPETFGGATYEVSTYANLNPATIKGAEAGYQQFFTFLPAPLDGLGLQANFTHVDSTTPSSVQGYTIPLTNLSRNSYNLILMYEKGPFSARLAYNWRAKYVTGVSSFVGVGLLPQFVRAYGDLDGSINFNLTKNIEITVQAVNLTNVVRAQYFTTPEYPSNYYLDGTEAMASITYRL